MAGGGMHRGIGGATVTDFDLGRFVDAQDGVHEVAVAELRAGNKESHWMWFIFPQFAGLGLSAISQRYAIGSLDEARAYLRHPVLGPRLVECTTIVNGLQGRTAAQVFGSPDDMKLRSSMTLFERAAGTGGPFTTALEKYFAGKRDPKTIALLGGQDGSAP